MTPPLGPHSPFPWRGNDDESWNRDLVEAADGSCVASDVLPADVAVIVKAVNVHDELVAALRLYVEHFGDPLKVARAALAKADAQ